MEIIDLIPYGQKNAVSRKFLLAYAIEEGIIDRNKRDPDREMRKLMSEAKFHGNPILYNTYNGGYYRPTQEEIADLRAYIKSEEGRAKNILASLNSAKAVLSDIERGLTPKAVLPKRSEP